MAKKITPKNPTETEPMTEEEQTEAAERTSNAIRAGRRVSGRKTNAIRSGR